MTVIGFWGDSSCSVTINPKHSSTRQNYIRLKSTTGRWFSGEVVGFIAAVIDVVVRSSALSCRGWYFMNREIWFLQVSECGRKLGQKAFLVGKNCRSYTQRKRRPSELWLRNLFKWLISIKLFHATYYDVRQLPQLQLKCTELHWNALNYTRHEFKNNTGNVRMT
jgi:hypothetical protein